jgi:hypothetical protein
MPQSSFSPGWVYPIAGFPFPVGSIRCNEQVGRTQQITTISCVYEQSRIDVSDLHLMYFNRKEEKGIYGDERWEKHGEKKSASRKIPIPYMYKSARHLPF